MIGLLARDTRKGRGLKEPEPIVSSGDAGHILRIASSSRAKTFKNPQFKIVHQR